MPLIVLAALFIAFWSPVALVGEVVGGAPGLRDGMPWVLGSILLLGASAAILGELIVRRVRREGRSTTDRRRFSRLSRGFELLALVAFGLVIHLADWPLIVADRLGFRGWVVLREAVVLLPFPAMLLGIWAGLDRADRLLNGPGTGKTPVGRLLLKFRQAFGLIVPVAALFAIVQAIGSKIEPGTPFGTWIHLGLFATLGAVVLVLSPALIRLSWPCRPMPAGPLRDRLERLADRFGFRYTEILVWETGGTIINAGVTGVTPWFRYVLLTDAMVNRLPPHQIEAVFGHEVGHIAHRHLGSFGVFFLGTMGVMALLNAGLDRVVLVNSPLAFWGQGEWVEVALKVVVALSLAVAYFFVVFGFLSRWFERQADVFGCRVVSCGRDNCPPHPDVNALALDDSPGVPDALCPVGIRIFIDALSSVAMLNGMEPGARSWRHGSIARRIAFLKDLEGRPEVERHFQSRLRGLRLGLAVALATALVFAASSGALDSFR